MILKRGESTRHNATPFSLLGSIAALFFIGSGMGVIYQILVSLSKTAFSSGAFVTLIVAVIPILIGMYAIRLAWRAGPLVTVPGSSRIKMFALAIVGLFFWAGLFVGPIFAVLASVSPGYRMNRMIWG